ncbi:MAG: pyridoxamine 5'-phosphate oxidase family protein [Oscillospiraceae bacterium]|nr:pyridoxamine 5'-phosphate oxidase family protein [Oscillospiraceae bacterium]
MKRVYDFLKEARTYYLATVEGDQPRVRPFGTIALFEDKLYFQTGLVKKVAKQLEENPKFEICAMKGGEWIRVSGEAVLDERPEAQQHMLDEHPNLKNMYSVGDGNTAVYWIKNGVAVISSYTADPVTIEF